MRRIISLTFILIIIIGISYPVYAKVQPPSYDELLKSSLIILGHISGIREGNKMGDFQQMFADCEIKDVLKGNSTKNMIIVIDFSNWIGNSLNEPEDFPRGFINGKTYLLFLDNTSLENHYKKSGWFGAYGEEAQSITILNRKTNEFEEMARDELINKIKLMLEEQSRLNRIEASRPFDKRLSPQNVTIIDNGIKYTPNSYYDPENGRTFYIEAGDINTGEKLWEQKIYEIQYDLALEHDVQDKFISSLRIEDGKLIIINENNDKYELNLKTKEVTKVTAP